jgi:hypothetical protein
MERRRLLSGGVMAGMSTALGAQRSGAQQPDTEAVSSAIDDLRQTIDRGQQVSPELARIREQQRVFLRANQKFPDYIEIGIAVWESVYDWHIRHQLPIEVTRTPEGRYSMVVMLTNLVLRPEQPETFVGFGFDLR